MASDFTMMLTLQEKRGPRRYQMALDLPVETFGERLAGEMALGIAFAGPDAFDKTASVLKEKKFRRDLLIAASNQIARQLADYLEDSEGWHGEDRQEKTLDHMKRVR